LLLKFVFFLYLFITAVRKEGWVWDGENDSGDSGENIGGMVCVMRRIIDGM
jgi:hypothetical protein